MQLQQISGQATFCCLPRTMNQVILDTKVKLMRCLEIRMSCKIHDVELTHACLKPVTYGRSPEIMECACLDVSPFANFAKIPAEVVDHLQSGI